MSRTARVFEVLIASPGDVSNERQILIECIEDWNSSHSEQTSAILLPRRWELDVSTHRRCLQERHGKSNQTATKSNIHKVNYQT
jgi:hypothetical protein